MKFAKTLLLLCCTHAFLLAAALNAQQVATSSATAAVPQLVNFSGKAIDAQDKPIAGIAGITFSIYKDQYEGAPLWMETQNVQTDVTGNYTVQLGARSSTGLPLDLFTSGEAHWLGVRVNGGEEQPRTPLLSVPYALKAADAQTLGGLPPSAFLLAAPPVGTNGGESPAAGATAVAAVEQDSPATSSDVTTTGGTVNSIPMFTTAMNIQNSLLTQTGTTAVNLEGKLNLPALGTATASTGFSSQPQTFVASSYNSSSKAAVPQTFQWQGESVGNDTGTPSGTLNLLFSSGATKPAETGLKISNKGLITFATGQTLPSVSGNETVIGDLTASQLTSTVATGTAPLKVTSTTEVANLNASLLGGKAAGAFATIGANTFTGNQAVTGNITATGIVGVGTATPANQLDVHAESYINAINAVGFSNPSGDGGAAIVATGGNNINTDQDGGPGLYATGGAGGNGGDGIEAFGAIGDGEGIDGSGGRFAGGNSSSGAGDGMDAYAGSGLAGSFTGDVDISGTLSEGGGSFKIDHPLDPANKYLYHSFVESPDMMNVYNGNVVLDSKGEAVVEFPDWFGALNRDFRYQLTSIGGFAPIYVAEEISKNRFRIAGGRAGLKVSWQVTGVRQDAWANAHRIPVEQEKDPQLHGYYIHPELYGASPEKQIEWARHPQMMKKLQENRRLMEKQVGPTQSAALQASTK
jgi:trimeric autotransporter adhesin